MKKKDNLKRNFIYDSVNNILKHIIDRHMEYELTKSDVVDSIKSAEGAIRNLKAQRRQLLGEINEYKEILDQYKKNVIKFKEVKDEKREAGKG